MPSIGWSPPRSFFAAFTSPPLHTFLRSAGYKLRPPRPCLHQPLVTRAQDKLHAHGKAERRQRSTLLCEQRPGSLPTIVLGGFVPDATEQVFLFRGFLLGRGSVYYFNYPRGGFSADLFCAQLDDLVAELNEIHGQRPVIFAVSFGAGLLLEWLRSKRLAGLTAGIAGGLIVSPVSCTADVFDTGETKSSTLLGRALKPYLETGGTPIDAAGIEKSRAIFARMFEAGAQNKASLRTLLSPDEFPPLRDRVLASIRQIDRLGAVERVRSLTQMAPLPLCTNLLGKSTLSEAPTLVLFAEKEGAVLTANSPTRQALTTMLPTFFPHGEFRVVTGDGPHPVQHASLIFHYFQFLPHIVGFYRELKSRNFRLAA